MNDNSYIGGFLMSCKCCHDHECECHEHEEENEENDEKKELIISLIRLGIGLILLIVAIILEKNDSVFTDFDWSNFTNSNYFTSLSFISFIIYTIAYIFLVIDMIKEMIEEIKEGNIINEVTLMFIATLGAYCLGEFFESVLVILLNIVGEMLEDYASNKSRKSIKSLINNMPLVAHKVISEDKIEDEEPEHIKIGDIIEIRPGEKIALDGQIIKGSTSLDLSSLNGESLPKDAKENDLVYSGSINLSSAILIKVTKEYKDSTLTKIMELVEEEQAKKAKTEKFITRFAKYYTPIVVLIAVAVFLIGFGISNWDFNNGGRDYLYKALSILLVSCPCALVIGVPIAFFSGIGVASKYGILIKGSLPLENLARSKNFVFDKTGTLTKGNFVLTNTPSKENLLIAASLESKSNHPLGNAILNTNTETLLPVESFENVPGLGIKGIINNEIYIIGNLQYLKDSGITNIEVIQTPYKVLFNN